jgi:hypothetical protein
VPDALERKNAVTLATHQQTTVRPVQQQLAVARVILDEVERSLIRADLSLQLGLGEQLADELEGLARSIRKQADLPIADPYRAVFTRSSPNNAAGLCITEHAPDPTGRENRRVLHTINNGT